MRNFNYEKIYAKLLTPEIVQLLAQIHEHIMKDLSVLQDAPFTDNGSIVEVFTDMSVWLGIKRIIDSINANAIAA